MGQFTIPDPNSDLQTFLSAQQGLSNAIDMILAQENISQNPANVGSLPSRPLIFASNWLSSEVGNTDRWNKFEFSRVRRKIWWLSRSIVFDRAYSGAFISRKHICNQAIKPDLSGACLPDAHGHPCVNRLVLAAGNTAGSWPTPTYALGRYQLDNNGLPMRDKPLVTYLIVNICLDLGEPAVIDQQSVLRPNAMIYSGVSLAM